MEIDPEALRASAGVLERNKAKDGFD